MQSETDIFIPFNTNSFSIKDTSINSRHENENPITIIRDTFI